MMDYNPVQPALTFNYLDPLLHVPSPIVPQNPMRPTNKGCGNCEGSTMGNALAGLGALGQNDLLAQYQPPRWLTVLYGFLRLAGTGLGAYHGYRRNNSIGWAIGWGLLGGLFPVITTGVAFAQGFGERR